MNEKNIHGSVFKKLREERGYKLKDVAGDIISTRTLTRFENDETSLPIATFEKLLKNCDLASLDYLAYYVDNTGKETTEFAKRMQSYIESGSSAEIVNECMKELKKSDIKFAVRLDILNFMQLIEWNGRSELFEENKRIIKERIESTSKLGWSEINGLINLINSASSENYSCEYIDRIIEECLQSIPIRNALSNYFNVAYCNLLISSLSFLSRNGYYELAEDRCKQTLNIFNEQSLLINKLKYYIDVIEILARVYLYQNKKEGIELARKVLKYRNTLIENINNPLYKHKRDISYKEFCKVNKTGIAIEF
jgi:hypothetical protein